MKPRSLLVMFVLWGCSAGDGHPPATEVPHHVLAPDLSIGEMEGDDALLFARVTGIAGDADGRIYVVDGEVSEVRVFGPDGTHVATIGRQGGGPGEFAGPCCPAVDTQGRLWVRDDGNGRFTVFDPRPTPASVLHTVPIFTNASGFWAATHFDGRGHLMQVGHRVAGAADVLPDQVLMRTDTTGAALDSVRIPTTPTDSIGLRIVPSGDGGTYFLHPPHGPRELIAHGPGGRWAKALSSEWYVAVYGLDGALQFAIEREGEVGPGLTADERERALESSNRQAERLNLSASDRFDVPDRKPPMSDLFFDEAGRLWVQRSTRPDEPNRAEVYDVDGALAFTAEWPAGITLSLPGRVGDRVALGLAVDSLGVQRIVRLPLR